MGTITKTLFEHKLPHYPTVRPLCHNNLFTIQPPPHHYQITLPHMYYPTFLKFYHYLSISLVPPYYLDLYYLNIIPSYHLTTRPSYNLTTITFYHFKTMPFFHPTSQHLPAMSLFIVTLFIFIYLSNKTDPY